MKIHFPLPDANQRQQIIKAILEAPEGYVVTLQEPTRGLSQNALYHAQLHELEGREWAGQPRDFETWKLLTISGHAVATGRPCELAAGLEDELVNLREPTSKMSISRMSSLISYVRAWMDWH